MRMIGKGSMIVFMILKIGEMGYSFGIISFIWIKCEPLRIPVTGWILLRAFFWSYCPDWNIP